MAETETGRQTSSDTAVRITEGQRLTLLMTAVAGHGIKHLFNAAFFVLLPEIKTGLGLSNVQVGVLSTVRMIVGGLANLPAGFIADRFPQRRAEILGLSIALIGVTGLVLGLTRSFWMATIMASLMVVAISFWHPAAISSLSRQFAQRRGFAISLHGTGGSVGEALGPLTAGLLLGLFSWQVIFQGSVMPAVLLGIGIWLILRTVPTEEGRYLSLTQYTRGLGHLVADRRLLLVLLFAGGFAGGQSVVLTFFPIYVREDLGASSATLGLYLFLAQVTGIGSQPVMGYVSDKLGRKVVLVPALAILGASYFALSVVPSGLPLIGVILLMGAFLYSLMAIFVTAAMDLVEGEVQATTVSLVFGVATAVAGIAPGIAGVFADAFGVTSTFLFAAGLILTTALAAGVTNWQGDREATAS